MVNSSRHSAEPRIIVALDFAEKNAALALVDQLDPSQCRLKIGKQMFTLFGPQLINDLHQRNFDVFLDLKFHDIPNTVASACAAAADLGVWMVNVHASGGRAMMEKTVERLAEYGEQRPKLIAVTVLTSMAETELSSLGISGSLEQHVKRLASLTAESGFDGVVCSAQEAQLLSQDFGRDFVLVTPGIRPANADLNDQTRVVTPRQAISNGSHYLVIGRPITQANDPLKALCDISDSLA